MSSRSTPIFCYLFILIGLIITGIGVDMFAKSLRAEHWPVTDGIIRSAAIKSHAGNHGSTTYSAAVTYSYQVAGTTYTGDKVSIGQMSAAADYAHGIVNHYPVGKKVAVHYAPANPADAVLETGFHGGMGICLGGGTVFTLFGILFLQISRAAARAQVPGAAENSSVTVQPDGSVTLAQPPVLMGVIFLVVGIGLGCMHPDSDKPGWLMYAVGGMFAAGGLLLLLYRLEDKVYSRIATLVVVALFLVIFHWISFGAGDRNGTVSTPFSLTPGVNVRTPFAIFTLLLDGLLVAGWLHALFTGPFAGENKWKFPLAAGLVLVLGLAAGYFMLPKSAAPRKASTEAPFVSTPIDDAYWLKLDRRHADQYRKQLRAAPPVLVVRESPFAFNPANGMGMHYGWIDGRMANLHLTLSELVAVAYGRDATHTEFPEEWTHGHWRHSYDVIVTVTNQPQAALQSAAQRFLRQQYGLAWHEETRDTNVLVLRVLDPQLLQSQATRDFAHSKSIPEFTGELENYFGEPVLDETGATNRYAQTIGEVPSRWVNGRSTDLDFNNQFLATVGLELVATHRPQVWLIMDR